MQIRKNMIDGETGEQTIDTLVKTQDEVNFFNYCFEFMQSHKTEAFSNSMFNQIWNEGNSEALPDTIIPMKIL